MGKRGITGRGACLAAGLSVVWMLAGCGASEENTAAADAMIQELDYQGALEKLAAAEEAGENERLVNRTKGIAYMGLTEYEEAITSFETALQGSNGLVQNVDFDLNYYLAAAYVKTGEYERAEEIYDAILALRTEEDAYFLRGNVRMALADFEGAKEDFDRVIAMDPSNYDRLIDIYEVLDTYGYREVGREYLQAALDSGSKQMDNYCIGRIYYYLGEYQKACLALEDAREKGGVKSYLYLGRSYEATGDYNYAASVYNSYLSKYDPDAEVYNQLGLCEMAKGEYEKALEHFQAGNEMGDSSVLQSLSFNEVVAYEYLGEYKTAAALLARYLSSYPDDEQAKREYGFLATR
jgi:tetratricopeptide (TPR) repeat protein